jgi:hypothetical protein
VNASELSHAPLKGPPHDGLYQRGTGLAAEKRRVPAEDSQSAGRTPPPRGKEGTQPDRVSLVWNTETPTRSRRREVLGRPDVRRVQALGGNRMSKKPMPVTERWQETEAELRRLRRGLV